MIIPVWLPAGLFFIGLIWLGFAIVYYIYQEFIGGWGISRDAWVQFSIPGLFFLAAIAAKLIGG